MSVCSIKYMKAKMMTWIQILLDVQLKKFLTMKLYLWNVELHLWKRVLKRICEGCCKLTKLIKYSMLL